MQSLCKFAILATITFSGSAMAVKVEEATALSVEETAQSLVNTDASIESLVQESAEEDS